MHRFNIDAEGNLNLQPSHTSSKHDFDFFEGEWTIRNRKLKTRLSNCDEWDEFDASQEVMKILNGMGNVDFFHAMPGGRLFEGMTLRLFNPETRLWSIYWADSNFAKLDPPVQGSFEDHIGYFYGKDMCNGKEVVVAFQWDARDPDAPVWSQAFSEDNGKTWEWNWYMYIKRNR